MEPSYRFGTVEVRPAERQVLVAGKPAPLGARAFDLLVDLIEHRDRVVTKDELLDRVWAGLVVEENNLQVHVSALRKILGTQSVATIPGRGYRFTLPMDGAAPPAPSCPLPERRHNLPAALNSFVGREREMAEVREHLVHSRLVTLTSIGGTGKSRLSLQVGMAVLEDFPDGVWFVELAPVADDDHVPHAVAAALGVKEDGARPMAEAVAGFARDKRLLLILDNCEHRLPACSAIARRLLQAARDVKILASSRERLHVAGEAVYPLPALGVPAREEPATPEALQRHEAVRLFVDRAREARPRFTLDAANGPAVAEVCRRLDGIPLAIELAAARVRALSPEKIAQRLDDCFRLLTRGDRSALERQQTLRASIDWSHDLLDAAERTLLRRLAVFAGGWTLEAAESVCAGDGLPREEVVDVLAQLVEKSLVECDAQGERYRLLETVRQYALERLAEAGEETPVRLRHLDHYLALAESGRAQLGGPAQERWMAGVDRERENLLAAYAACDASPEGSAQRLRLAWSLRLYAINRGILGFGHRLATLALERHAARDGLRCHGLFAAGQLAAFMGRYEDARGALQESLAIARELGDATRIAAALQPLAMVCLGMGDLDGARAFSAEALERARGIDDPRGLAAALTGLAQVERLQGQLAEAGAHYEEAVQIARQIGDQESVAIGLLNLSMTALDRGHPQAAQPLLAEALRIVEGTGAWRVGQSVIEVCAGLAAAQGRWEHAARLYGAADAQLERNGLQRDASDEAFLAPRLQAAREALGQDFAAAEAAGRATGYAEAMALAREVLGEPA